VAASITPWNIEDFSFFSDVVARHVDWLLTAAVCECGRSGPSAGQFNYLVGIQFLIDHGTVFLDARKPNYDRLQ
jgi:hypothetical protein